jgi:hypothetical protein
MKYHGTTKVECLLKSLTRIFSIGIILLVCMALMWPSAGYAANSKGTIKVLGVRVLFKDKKNAPTEKTIEGKLNQAKSNFGKYSYGKLNIVVVTETVTLNQNRTSYSNSGMKAAARSWLIAKGHKIAAYEIIGYYPGGTHFGNHATVGGSEFVASSAGGSTMHEMGHNFGWGHQSFWNVTSGTDPVGAGKLTTPDLYHFMKNAAIHPEPSEKWGRGWITDRHAISSNGSYTKRLYTFDQKNIASANSKRAIRVKRTTSTKTHFWLGYRSTLTKNQQSGGNNNELRQGLGVWWERSSGNQTALLDMNPNNGALDNHSLQPGETFADTAGDLYITSMFKLTVELIRATAPRLRPGMLPPPGKRMKS